LTPEEGACHHDGPVSDFLIPLITFFLGVFLAPVVRPLLRPLFVELIRASLVTVDEAQRLTAQVRESIEDAAAEAKAQQAAKAASAAQPPPADPPPPPAA
jgi:hypothetical protein